MQGCAPLFIITPFPSSYRLQSLPTAISRFNIHSIFGLPRCRHCRRTGYGSIKRFGFRCRLPRDAERLRRWCSIGPQQSPKPSLEATALCQVLKDLVGFLLKDDLNGRRFDSSSVLCIAIKACQCRLEELGAKLANLSEASSKKLPGWVERMKWPLKKDELEQTVCELHRFTQIFQFSMVIQNGYV
jgi:hypothetical protein